MKVTINGITYEGTEEEIRRIVANPPQVGCPVNQPIEFPDNTEREIREWPMKTYPWPNEVPHYPWPDSTPHTWPNVNPTNPNDWPWRNWDGTPRVTCGTGVTYRDILDDLGM